MRALAKARRPNRWHGLAAAIAALVIALFALGDALQVAPTTEQASSPSPQASLSPTPVPTTAAAWAPIELPPLEPVATFEPSRADDAGIAPDTTFALASLTDEPADGLAKRLEITPAAPYAVVRGTTPDTVTIRPQTALTAGTTYRFVLHGAGGAIAASWAYRVRGPVRVRSTLPADATVGVPVRTGIEVTFDQDDVAAMSANFSIEPVVSGTFERHGRTQVFVPSSLAPATLYTVTIRKGLARTGTDLALEEDAVFRFETGGPETDEARLVFGREALEAAPGDPPLIAVRAIRPWVGDGRAPAPTSARLRVYRFGSIDAASRALSRFLDAPRWTAFTEPRVPTDGLDLVAAFTAPLEPFRDDTLLLHYPETLPRGIYVLELQGPRASQAVLQVTSVSAWVSVVTDRTVAWVNDVARQGPIEGARVSLEGGGRIATSDADGLAIGSTPAALRSPLDDATAGYPILRVTGPSGEATLVPFNVGGDPSYRGEWWEMSGSADERYWSMLSTDRGLYRRVDRIEAWGFLRGRDDGQVPTSVTLRLVLGNADADPDIASVAETEVHPGPEGAFTATLPVEGLPINGYVLQAVVDGHVVVSRWLDVTVIRKPAYQLELNADRRAVIAGDRVTWTAQATFFDGTPVPSLDLAISDNQGGSEHRVTTDVEGRATYVAVAKSDGSGPWSSWWVEARPNGPESGEISASSTVMVVPTSDFLSPHAVLGDGRLRVTGSLVEIDFADFERRLAASPWDWEPSGRPVAGVAIDVAITELVPVRRQIGSEYDFVEKVVRPVYDHDTERRPLPGVAAETAADGTFTVSVAVPDDRVEYELTLTARDRAGRSQGRMIWARRAGSEVDEAGVAFVNPDGQLVGGVAYRIGATVDWRMVDDGRALPSGGPDRYLYLVAQRGLRSAAVTRTPRFRRTFGAADAPGVFVIGVRFTGTTYAPKAASWANFDQTQREIEVAVTADRPAYKPGETATLSVRTTDSAGRPVPATVLLQAVDEKLYAMGGAVVPQPLDDLYRRVDSGILRLTATHQVPSMAGPEGEGGDTTGGGARSDFRDTLLFRMLRTDASGRASATVRLSDDLTSWHVSAGAVTADLAGGVGELLVPVRLPFFVELTLADTYQVADRPVVLARAFGSELRAGDEVEFIASSTSLGMPDTTVRGRAFESVQLALPALGTGPQAITVQARTVRRTDDAGRPYADGLTKSFEVVGSRLTATAAAFGTLERGGEVALPTLPAGAESTTWTFTDAGRGRLLPTLVALADSSSLRIDARIARQGATDMLVSAFGRDPGELPAGDFDSGVYPYGRYDEADGAPRAGVALLPYADLDPWLAARIAILAPSALRPDIMDEVLNSIRDEPSTRRDLWIAATAGLAALGHPVLEDLAMAAGVGDLSQGERLYLALGFEAAGDDASALRIERELLAADGETLGPWVRLRSARTADGSDATALLAVVAAGLGDSLAAGLADYAAANPAPDAFDALELVAYAGRTLDRTPATTASFAYTVDGRRRVVELEAGGAFWLRLTTNQAGGLEVENLSGRVGVAVEGRVPVPPSSLVAHPDLRLTRDLPGQPIATDSLVEVNLGVEFEPGAPDGCYDVREVAPSGLAPLAMGWGQTDDQGITWPSSVVGQEVRFCAFNDAESGRTARLRYVARVVNEGTFAWEPAVLQFADAAELMAVTPAATVTIGAP